MNHAKLKPTIIISIFSAVIAVILLAVRFFIYDNGATSALVWKNIFVFVPIGILLVWSIFLLKSECFGKGKNSKAFILIAVGLTIVLAPMLYTRSQFSDSVTIMATGEKNEDAISSEVWLQEILVNGNSVDLSIYENTVWKLSNNNLLATELNSPITIDIPQYETLTLNFAAHRFSGFVQVGRPGFSSTKDLFSLSSSSVSIDIPAMPQPNYIIWLGTLLLVFCACCMLLYLYIVFHKSHQTTPAQLLSVGVAIIIVLTINTTLWSSYTFGVKIFYVLLNVLLVAISLMYLLRSKKQKHLLLGVAAAFSVMVLMININSFIVPQQTHFQVSIENNKHPVTSNADGQEMYIRYIMQGDRYLGLATMVTEGKSVTAEGLGPFYAQEMLVFEAPAQTELNIEVFFDEGGESIVKIEESNGTNIEHMKSASYNTHYISRYRVSTPKITPNYLYSTVITVFSFFAFGFLFYYIYIPVFSFLWNGKALNNGNKQRGLIFSYLISVATPLAFLFYLYRNNADYLSFSQTVIFAAAISLISIYATFILVKKTNAHSASLIMMCWWIFFFTYSSLFKALHFTSVQLYFTVSMLLFFLLMALLHTIGTIIKHVEIIIAFSVGVSVVLLFNLIPSVSNVVRQVNSENLYKTVFFVEDSLSEPDIYWFHMDGMLGFAAIEEYFGDSQDFLKDELANRGFVLNEYAYFEANHSTAYSLPALMSPQYYDTTLESIYSNSQLKEAASLADFYNVQENLSLLDMADALYEVRANNELIAGFQARGYETNTISTKGFYFFPNTTRFYNFASSQTPFIESFGEDLTKPYKTATDLYSLNELLSSTTMLGLVESQTNKLIKAWENSHYLEKPLESSGIQASNLLGPEAATTSLVMVSSLEDSLSTPSPKLTIIADFMAHRPFYYSENGELVNFYEEGNNVLNYMPQHKYAATVMLGMIDMILDINPDAIIVLQADHGIHHGDGAIQMVEEFGYTMDQVRDIWNSTMSAVRIPDQFGGLDEPLDPLNITRELVNRYVGKNYDLLPADHPNQKKQN